MDDADFEWDDDKEALGRDAGERGKSCMKKRIKYTNEPMKARIIEDFLPPPEKLRLRQSALKVT